MILFLTAVICFFAFSLLCVLFWKKPQHKVPVAVVVGLIAILVLGLLFLIGSGRMHWLAGTVAALFPFLRRGFGLLRFVPFFRVLNNLGGMSGFSPFRSGAQSAPNTSETETSELRMTLDHSTNSIEGEVLTGQFAGRTLNSLTKEEIVALASVIREEQSRRLLGSYISRYHPDLETVASEESASAETDSPSMDVGRACAVLGVNEDASKDEILDAYKRLIQHVHPDRGGSGYLTSELNEAKKVLLDRLP